MSMFGDFSVLQDQASAALPVIHHMYDRLCEIERNTNPRQGTHWDESEGGNAPGGSDVVLTGIRVPLGKRLTVTRISTTAPVNSGPALIYANTGGGGTGAVLDGGSLREVIAVPNFYAQEVSGTMMVRGGLVLVVKFVAAVAGIVTIRYDGLLHDDTEPGDLAH